MVGAGPRGKWTEAQAWTEGAWGANVHGGRKAPGAAAETAETAGTRRSWILLLSAAGCGRSLSG
jgi:hypothetical protein